MPSILFVCFANRFRSPLAAAFFCQCLEKVADRESWSVGSAGTWAENGLPAASDAIQDASGWGLDVRPHRSRQVDANILSQNDMILVMEAGQKEALRTEFPKELKKIYLLSEVADGAAYDIPDPFGAVGISHQEVATELFALITRGFSNIYHLAIDSTKPLV
jgi:protein-tyrosine phosphatase